MVVQVAGSVGSFQRSLQRDQPGELPEVSPALSKLLEAGGEAGLLPRPVHLYIYILHMGQFPQDGENGQNVALFNLFCSSAVAKRFDFFNFSQLF